MRLYDIVKKSTFQMSRNKHDVRESFYLVISKLTGQYLSKSDNDKHYCDLVYKLIKKYMKRKVNKEKFLRMEREWL